MDDHTHDQSDFVVAAYERYDKRRDDGSDGIAALQALAELDADAHADDPDVLYLRARALRDLDDTAHDAEICEMFTRALRLRRDPWSTFFFAYQHFDRRRFAAAQRLLLDDGALLPGHPIRAVELQRASEVTELRLCCALRLGEPRGSDFDRYATWYATAHAELLADGDVGGLDPPFILVNTVLALAAHEGAPALVRLIEAVSYERYFRERLAKLRALGGE